MAEYTHYIPPEALGKSWEEDSLRVREALTDASWQHFTPEFVGTKVQELDIDKVETQMSQFRTIYEEGRIGQTEGKVCFGTTQPITVFFVGDIHYGSVYTNHETFREEMTKIAETPNAYIVWMSNLIDNAIPGKFPANMLSNSIPPDKQVVAMRKICQELDERGKILGAVTSDCHEGWCYQVAGQDVNAMIHGFEGRKYAVLENGGRLLLETPGATYTLGLYHKIGPFRSNFNLTHGVKQMNRLRQGMQCDVVVGAHYHNAAVEECYDKIGSDRRQLIYVQCGSYKGIDDLHDTWAIERFGATGEPTAQSITFMTTKKAMDGHLAFETGMLAHESYLIRHLAGFNGV